MQQTIFETGNGAVISDCKKHRYALWRIWDDTKPLIMFIGVNPSRADHEYNDPTITRCIRFASGWGYGGLFFANLFSFRTPYPAILIENFSDAIGDECNDWLIHMGRLSEKVVACWGSWNFIEQRSADVLSMIAGEKYCFGTNKDGQPKHPLYLKSTTSLIPYQP